MIEQHETFRQAAQKVLVSLVNDWISGGVKMVADYTATIAKQTAQALLGQTTQTAAVETGEAARMAAQASGASAGVSLNLSVMATQIQASASEAFAGVTGFLAPIMGPAAVGPAAAVEGTVLGMASFAQGSWALPSDMVAQVHAGEMIVPASHTPWMQSLAANAAGGGGNGGGSSGGGGDVHNHFHVQGHVLDNRGLAKTVADVFNKHPSTRPKY
jgi:hypothetical protein